VATIETAPVKAPRARVPLAIGIAAVMYLSARVVLEAESIALVWRIGAAIAPILAAGWLIYELIRSSRDLDEMQKRIQLEALATAYSVVFLLLMLLGLLELAIPLNRNDWAYRHVWQMQGIIYLAGLVLAQRRYGVHEK
jgi:hypothetical protein